MKTNIHQIATTSSAVPVPADARWLKLNYHQPERRLKLRSSMTLFASISEPDSRTPDIGVRKCPLFVSGCSPNGVAQAQPGAWKVSFGVIEFFA